MIDELKFIIEFDGRHWHSSNPERDAIRAQALTDEGYIIYRVSDEAYVKNKDLIIQECVKEILMHYAKVGSALKQ